MIKARLEFKFLQSFHETFQTILFLYCILYFLLMDAIFSMKNSHWAPFPLDTKLNPMKPMKPKGRLCQFSGIELYTLKQPVFFHCCIPTNFKTKLALTYQNYILIVAFFPYVLLFFLIWIFPIIAMKKFIHNIRKIH